MAARVHALHVALVVATLRAVTRRVGRRDAGHAAEEQPDAGADPGALRAVDRRTGEVVSQIPREDVLKLHEADAYQAGAVIKTQA